MIYQYYVHSNKCQNEIILIDFTLIPSKEVNSF